MFSSRILAAAAFCASLSSTALAQSDTKHDGKLFVELNAVQDVTGSCRLTFLAKNETGLTIDGAVFETVVFDAEGGVVTLSLFDFRDLPADRPRVRQFDLPNRTCAEVGQVLINGTNSCLVDGAESQVCGKTLSLSSRVAMELLG
ncbi:MULTISPECIES: hypothetical protein [unclassified Ruegeria]|uniref:hypothetical protein n=1 Tax=unclassified Ruegeria TaxID=2625375 RepID=UPI0014888022|nr:MULTISPECIES: hypothetical protein [unclassified Ruegeria]NOD36099.1 hypothetical protein [Ruegeria sp. HKCCD7296]NOE43492.1 hypothetical protein [Ruegeria sp. HKCCD7319]